MLHASSVNTDNLYIIQKVESRTDKSHSQNCGSNYKQTIMEANDVPFGAIGDNGWYEWSGDKLDEPVTPTRQQAKNQSSISWWESGVGKYNDQISACPQ